MKAFVLIFLLNGPLVVDSYDTELQCNAEMTELKKGIEVKERENFRCVPQDLYRRLVVLQSLIDRDGG